MNAVEPILLVPGMMCDARVFLPQIEELSATRSLFVANITRGETIEEIAQSVLARAPERFALAGTGMGGIVGMEILRRAPERVSRVALISATAQAERPQQAAEREPMIILAKSGRLADAMQEQVRADYLAPGTGRAAVLATVQAMAESLGPEVFVRQSRAMQRRPDQQKTLRTTKVPACVIAGSYDAHVPVRRQEFIAELIPRASFHVIEGAGHLPTLEAPGELSAILGDWMSAPFVLG